MFTERLASWLARPSGERGINQPEGLDAIVSTDTGLVRNENQDLIAAIRVNTPSNVGKPFFAMALLDGMGGMQDGKQCATIALSTFFYSLIKFRAEKLELRLHKATIEANQAVYGYAKGHGGSTLSAIIIENEAKPVIVNVGDSRIYSFSEREGLNAISKDDSLEALGGRGKGLLQFIGMGESLKPHIHTLDISNDKIILTSDGIHFVAHSAFEEILFNAPNSYTFSNRMSEYVRWCGAKDNATLGMVSLKNINDNLIKNNDIGVELWDPYGHLHIMWMKNYPAAQNYFSQNIVDEQDKITELNLLEDEKKPSKQFENDKAPEDKINQGELFSSHENDEKNINLVKKNIKRKKPREKNKTINKENEDQSVVININDEENKNGD